MILEGAFSSLGICGRHILNDCQGLILVFNHALKLFVGRQFMAVVSADAFSTDSFFAGKAEHHALGRRVGLTYRNLVLTKRIKYLITYSG